MEDISRLCCSQVRRQTSFISLLGAIRPVISSNASIAMPLTTSSPSTTTHDGATVSRSTCICATGGGGGGAGAGGAGGAGRRGAGGRAAGGGGGGRAGGGRER